MSTRRHPIQLGLSAVAIAAAVLVVGLLVAWQGVGTTSGPVRLVAEPLPLVPDAAAPISVPATSAPATTAPAATTPAPAPTAAPTTAAPAPRATPPPTSAPQPKAAVATVTAPRGIAGGIEPFRGMGTWVDVFDFAPTYAKGRPVALGPEAVDAMAAEGVQVLYIQLARADWPGAGDIVDPEVTDAWLRRAEARGLKVVPWYLPTFVDTAADLRRLVAISRLHGVDGVGVDIESKAVADPDVRSARLVELSIAARRSLAGVPLSAIPLPNVDTDVVNPRSWPRFPWTQLRGLYDVWQPMGYWTNRTQASGYRDPYRYTTENVTRLRAALGQPDAVVHPIGGIGDRTTPADIAAYLRAVREQGCIGASLYDWDTQRPDSYAPMRAARS